MKLIGKQQYNNVFATFKMLFGFGSLHYYGSENLFLGRRYNERRL